MHIIEHDVNDPDMQMLTLERQRVLWRLNGEYILNTSNLNKYHKMDTRKSSNLRVAHNRRIYPRVLVSLDFNGDFYIDSVKMLL